MPILGIWASQISGHLWAPEGAYDALATVTVGSTAVSSVEFAGIPTGYKHLQIRYIVKNSSDAYTTAMQFNSDTGANYFWHILNGNGSTPAANAYTSQSYIGLPRTVAPGSTNVFYAGVVDILDYGSVVKNKTVRGLGGGDTNSNGHVDFTSGAWNNSSTAVTSMKLYATVGNLTQYSQFALYGVK